MKEEDILELETNLLKKTYYRLQKTVFAKEKIVERIQKEIKETEQDKSIILTVIDRMEKEILDLKEEGE